MNKTITILVLVLAFIGGFLLFYKPKQISSPTTDNSPASSTLGQWETKTDEQANVTVTITPSDISIDSKEWKFDVVMNTHSVELDQDMVKATILIDNPGEEYKPLRWEGAGPGGHHREGTLVFAPIKPYPQHLSLIIKGIGDKDKAFAWILNGE
ncbi:MAG: hypothetical protein WC657_04435 [Candidatus Paceibacterota bacterium]|jgi:hypothetical protein